LPEPFSPSRPCASPAATLRLTPASARTPPKLFERSQTSRAGIGVPIGRGSLYSISLRVTEVVAERRRPPTQPPGPVAVVGVSIAVLAAGTFAISAFGVLAPKLADAFALSRADIGFVTSVVFLGAALGSAPAGRLTDRGHPARLLALAMSAFAGSVLLFALAPDRAILFAAAALAGLAYGCVNPPTNVIVAGQLARRLGFFLSLKQTGVPLGGLLAGAVLPPVAIAWGWRAAVGVAAVACALAAAGLALALAQGLGACARLLWGWLSDKTGNRLGVLLLMAALQVVALELLALFPGRTLAWPLVALAGVTIVGWNGAFYGYVAESAGPGN